MDRVLFIDVDGTLLNSAHQLTERTRTTLRAAHDKGAVIVISSGRCADGVESIRKELGFPVYLSTLNGAYVINDRDEVISQSPFPFSDAAGIADLLDRHDMGYLYFSGPNWGSGKSEDYELEERIVRAAGLRQPLKEIVLSRPVHKILAVSRGSSAADQAFLTQLRASFPSYSIVPSSRIYTEINTPGTSKGAAVESVCAYLGRPVSQSVAFGDWDNDITMFRASHIAVCLANGSESAKREADVIAPSNDEDGLARWIEENLFS